MYTQTSGRLATPQVEQQWCKVYLLGGYAAIVAFLGTLFDIVYGSVSSADLTLLPQTAVERFAEFQQSWFLGLYHLDLLNVLTQITMIIVYFAVFARHRNKNLPFAAFTLLLAIMATTVFIVTNTALPMLELAQKYNAANSEAQQLLFAAAGEALLARGGHGSLGVFFAFLLSSLTGVFTSYLMLQGRIFTSFVSWFGFLGNALLLTYVILITFVPAIERIAVLMAAPGGLMSLTWVLLTGLQLIKMAKPIRCYPGNGS